jgi:hypothetical protein
MKIAAVLVPLLCTSVVGCANGTDPGKDGLFIRLSPLDYAERVCRTVDIEDKATCINRMLAIYQDPDDNSFPPTQSTSGPLMATLGGQNYYGWYRSQPFMADFRASDGRTTCRGSYNAFAGDKDAIFDVRCDDGRQGSANMILGADGSNGIGTMTMSNGEIGRIVFGRNALQGTPAAS